MAITEREVKKYFIKRLKDFSSDVVARKINYENGRGCPDWMVIFYDIYLVELKGTEGKLRKSQQNEIKNMAKTNVKVHVIDSKAKVDEFVRTIEWSSWILRG